MTRGGLTENPAVPGNQTCPWPPVIAPRSRQQPNSRSFSCSYLLFLCPFVFLFLSHTYCSCVLKVQLQLFWGKYFTDVWNQKSVPSWSAPANFYLFGIAFNLRIDSFYSPVCFQNSHLAFVERSKHDSVVRSKVNICIQIMRFSTSCCEEFLQLVLYTIIYAATPNIYWERSSRGRVSLSIYETLRKQKIERHPGSAVAPVLALLYWFLTGSHKNQGNNNNSAGWRWVLGHDGSLQWWEQLTKMLALLTSNPLNRKIRLS